MKNSTAIFLFALCPLVPVSSRFAYALVIALALSWYFVSGLAFRELVKKLSLASAGPTVELACLAFSATVFHLVLQWFSPVLAVTLGLYTFLAAFSYLLLFGIDTFTAETLESVPLLQFIPTLVLFSAARELLGFGCISLPTPKGLAFPISLPGFDAYGVGFWASTGGAFILLGILAWAIKYFHRRVSAYRRNS